MLRRLTLPAFLMILLVLVLAACGGDSEDGATVTEPEVTVASDVTVEPPLCSGADVINQDTAGSGQYRFSPDKLTYSVGEKVELTLCGETEFHTFNVDELEIDVSLDAGQLLTFEFTFDKAGEYRLYCIPHEAFGMVGTITVKE